jgi:hypothetical protein
MVNLSTSFVPTRMWDKEDAGARTGSNDTPRIEGANQPGVGGDADADADADADDDAEADADADADADIGFHVAGAATSASTVADNPPFPTACLDGKKVTGMLVARKAVAREAVAREGGAAPQLEEGMHASTEQREQLEYEDCTPPGNGGAVAKDMEDCTPPGNGGAVAKDMEGCTPLGNGGAVAKDMAVHDAATEGTVAYGAGATRGTVRVFGKDFLFTHLTGCPL